MKADREGSYTAKIASLNDRLRMQGRGGRLVITQGVHNLARFNAHELIGAISSYDRFDPSNDPYQERDFGVLELFGAKLMWKIDYYDPNLEFGSEDPADPDVTIRILTVMLDSEY